MTNSEHEYDPDKPGLKPEELFESHNNKELAAILLDVHNPIHSSEEYTPVVPRRGLPPDLSRELAAYLRPEEGQGYFESTWFTAREAVDFG